MQYNSPFHLLPKRDLSVLTNDDLKRWKKELLLQFDLNKSTTIDINQKEYDKNDILQAIDLLKDRPEYHWRLYQNKPLLNFIENGDINFFKDKLSQQGFYDKPYQDWLAKWFIPAYDDAIYECIEKEEERYLKKLKKICRSKFYLPKSWRNSAYQKTFVFFNNLINEAEEYILRKNYMTRKDPVKFLPKIHGYISVHYASVLTYLPDDFEYIKLKYAKFAYRFGIEVMRVHGHYLYAIEKKSLYTLGDAFQVDFIIRQTEQSLALMDKVRQHAPIPYQRLLNFSMASFAIVSCLIWIYGIVRLMVQIPKFGILILILGFVGMFATTLFGLYLLVKMIPLRSPR